jgi:hypothetical protein
METTMSDVEREELLLRELERPLRAGQGFLDNVARQTRAICSI